VFVCVCVCVYAREREREKVGEREMNEMGRAHSRLSKKFSKNFFLVSLPTIILLYVDFKVIMDHRSIILYHIVFYILTNVFHKAYSLIRQVVNKPHASHSNALAHLFVFINIMLHIYLETSIPYCFLFMNFTYLPNSKRTYLFL